MSSYVLTLFLKISLFAREKMAPLLLLSAKLDKKTTEKD